MIQNIKLAYYVYMYVGTEIEIEIDNYILNLTSTKYNQWIFNYKY